MDKQNVILTFKISKENRKYLALAGIIRHKDGRAIKHGDVTKVMNWLIQEKFATPKRVMSYLRSEILELELDRKENYKQQSILVENIRKIREMTKKPEN